MEYSDPTMQVPYGPYAALILLLLKDVLWDLAKGIVTGAGRRSWAACCMWSAKLYQRLKNLGICGYVVLPSSEYRRLRQVERALDLYVKASDELRASTERSIRSGGQNDRHRL